MDRRIDVCFRCGKIKPEPPIERGTLTMASDLHEAVAEIGAASTKNDETSATVTGVHEFLQEMQQTLASLYGGDSPQVQQASDAVMRCAAVITQIFVVGSEIDDLQELLAAMAQ